MNYGEKLRRCLDSLYPLSLELERSFSPKPLEALKYESLDSLKEFVQIEWQRVRPNHGKSARLVSIRVHSWLIPIALVELLESGIAAQRVPDRIQPEMGRGNGWWTVEITPIRLL